MPGSPTSPSSATIRSHCRRDGSRIRVSHHRSRGVRPRRSTRRGRRRSPGRSNRAARRRSSTLRTRARCSMRCARRASDLRIRTSCCVSRTSPTSTSSRSSHSGGSTCPSLGLLDRTHVQLFTEQRLLDAARAVVGGCRSERATSRSCGATSTSLPIFPRLRRARHCTSCLLAVRLAADELAYANQFVRQLRAARAAAARSSRWLRAGRVRPVGRRTDAGRRRASLPSCSHASPRRRTTRFEMLLFVHTSEIPAVDATQELVDAFDFGFARRVRVKQIVGGNRGRPLNAGLAAARGRYIAFIDDDDLVTADWVEAFARGSEVSPRRRSSEASPSSEMCAVRSRERSAGRPSSRVHFRFTFSPTFDFVEHCFANSTPICAFAVPVALRACAPDRVRRARRCAGGLAFPDALRLLRRRTRHRRRSPAIYHRWADLDGSRATIDEDVWRAARDLVLHEFDVRPILLPPGAVRSIVAFRTELEQFRGGETAEGGIALRATARRDAETRSHTSAPWPSSSSKDAKGAAAMNRAILDSRSWQITASAARAPAAAERVARSDRLLARTAR